MNYLIFALIGAVKLLFPQFWNVSTALLYAQAWHETGGFKSTIYRVNNNLFGMKLAKKRNTVASGEESGHATYPTILHSVYDYFLRQRNFNIKGRDAEEYVSNTVKSKYAEDKEYAKKWLNVYYQHVTNEKRVFLIVGFGLFLITLTKILKWLGIDVIEKARSTFKI